jgi:hypothetical protein
VRNSLRRVAITVLGFVLVIAGIAALILPGPGLLLLLAGLVVLSQEFEWAERRVEPVKKRAFDVARAGVETVPRIVLSTLGALGLLAVGVVWIVNPTVPEIGPFGPHLPAGGWATGSSIALSGLVALGLVVYSVKRFRVDAAEGSLSTSGQTP